MPSWKVIHQRKYTCANHLLCLTKVSYSCLQVKESNLWTKAGSRVRYSSLSLVLLILDFKTWLQISLFLFIVQRILLYIFLCVDDIIINMDAKATNTSMTSTASLSLCDETSSIKLEEYRKIIGSLQYLTITRRILALSLVSWCSSCTNQLSYTWQLLNEFSDTSRKLYTWVYRLQRDKIYL